MLFESLGFSTDAGLDCLTETGAETGAKSAGVRGPPCFREGTSGWVQRKHEIGMDCHRES